jgi:hypothetical protein
MSVRVVESGSCVVGPEESRRAKKIVDFYSGKIEW